MSRKIQVRLRSIGKLEKLSLIRLEDLIRDSGTISPSRRERKKDNLENIFHTRSIKGLSQNDRRLIEAEIERRAVFNVWTNGRTPIPDGNVYESITEDHQTFYYVIKEMEDELKLHDQKHRIFHRDFTLLNGVQDPDFRTGFLETLAQILFTNGLDYWVIGVKNLQTQLTEHYYSGRNFWKNIVEQINSSEYARDSAGRLIEFLHNQHYLLSLESPAEHMSLGYNVWNGSFFPYYHHLRGLDLTKYQIYTQENIEMTYNCLNYALMYSLKIPTPTLKEIRNQYFTEATSRKTVLGEISKHYNIIFGVHKYHGSGTEQIYYHQGHTFRGQPKDETCELIELGVEGEHWFLYQKIKCSKYALEHYQELQDQPDWWNITDAQHRRRSYQGVTSLYLVRYLLEHKELLTPIPIEQLRRTQYFNDQEVKVSDLNETEGPEYSMKSHKYKQHIIGYFDFETDPNEIHQAIGLAYQFASEYEGRYKDVLDVPDLSQHLYQVIEEALEGSTSTHLIMYAHNLKYDIAFLAETFLKSQRYRPQAPLILDGNVYEYKFYDPRYFNTISFRDTYKFISTDLSGMSKGFLGINLKEAFPYKLLTLKTLQHGVTREQLNNYRPWLVNPVKNELERFMNNVKEHQFIRPDGKIDLRAYCRHYCLQDVNILYKCFSQFQQLIQDHMEIDVFDYLTVSSLAHHWMIKQGAYQGVTLLSGNNHQFVQRSIVGGRVMVRNNQKGLIVNDRRVIALDACSLYPSAMFRLGQELGGVLLGNPKIIHSFVDHGSLHCPRYLINDQTKVDGFFVEVVIDSIGRRLDFPLIHQKTEEGLIDWNDDDSKIGLHLVVSMIEYEDLIQFQQCHLTVVGGLYYNQGRNPQQSKSIQQLHELRQQAKRDHNDALQQTCKIIMVSSYGKPIERPYRTKRQLCRGSKELAHILSLHSHFVIKDSELCPDIRVVEYYDEKFTPSQRANHVGSEILAMSKRIMNEVMVTAQEIGCSVYYQDTDSAHLDYQQLPQLCQEYQQRYHRELRGKNLGQFQVDNKDLNDYLNEEDRIVNDITCDYAIYLSKKLYYEQMIGKTEQGQERHADYYRSKGIRPACWTYRARLEHKSIQQLYQEIAEGQTLEFDLTNDQTIPSFEFEGLTIKNKTMTRKIHI